MGGGGKRMPTSSVALHPTGDKLFGFIQSVQADSSGSITSDELQNKYGVGECYFAAGTHNFEVAFGDIVEFDVGLNANGDPEASAVRPLADPDQQQQPAKRPRFNPRLR